MQIMYSPQRERLYGKGIVNKRGISELSQSKVSPITALLNAALGSIHELAPIEAGKPEMVSSSILQTDHGVLVGILGAIKGRLFITGEERIFAKAGFAMYGVELSGDMLESFVGEFGNSVAGHTATKLYEQGVKIDITPPTTMQGNVRLGGFSNAIQVPFQMNQGEKGHLVLAVSAV